MRAFGFRPAVEPGVLKREWHGLAVRVSAAGIRAARPGPRASWPGSPPTGRCSSTARPTPAGRAGVGLIQELLDLIGAYERWVEAREGREGRIRRSAARRSPTGAP